MRLKAMMIAIMLVLVGTGSALAVGYERYFINGPSPVGHSNKAATCRNLENALKKASLVEQYPKVLDEVAFTVKDILSQFGLVDRQTP
ncbi:MAG: hypothetical protein P8182_01255 [Deltaproteobacteria bacterium]